MVSFVLMGFHVQQETNLIQKNNNDREAGHRRILSFYIAEWGSPGRLKPRKEFGIT